MAKRRKNIQPIYPYNPLEENPAPTDEPAPVKNTHTRLLVCLAVFATACTVIFVAFVLQHITAHSHSRNENNALRQMAVRFDVGSDTYMPSPVLATHIHAFDALMREINPNFVCWIRIEGTRIDYPVVRAQDNERYLTLTFTGTYNENGAVFMDYRNTGDFVPHLIIYGHNTRYGTMFSDLHRFLCAQFLAQHNTISLIINGEVVEYKIFCARRTDIYDPAFFLDFTEAGAFHDFLARINAPENAVQILTLSTCVSGNNINERVLVQGALIRKE
ncbi:MAG: class B sortase [Defluviitaleaceae bacterium]|nr:class B sortase [Defluviitaleaceae bacterium]MCL2274805.1 class B sortase [Defluviitaleaceae bacterium]